MHLNILENFNKYINLNSIEKDALLSIIQEKQVSKREIIQKPNIVCNFQTYVLKGALRSYFITPKGVEHTISFAIEDWFISDFNSYIHQAPASLYIEALENSTIQQINFSDVEQLCKTHLKFERFFRMAAQKAFAFSQQRILSNLEHSAEERYLRFKSKYPSIVQRVPQYTLASYLGISAEFLSKIRKKTQS